MFVPFNTKHVLKLTIILNGFGLFWYPQAYASPHNADHLVSGIMSYTTWEENKDNINFCIIDGTPEFISTTIFRPPSPLIQANNIKISNLRSQDLAHPLAINTYTCDVLYFVETNDDVQQKIISQVSSKHLSVSENNPECTIGSSFCLYYKNQRFSFKVNLNNLKKSRIRVNSKVLMLSKSGGESE